MSLFSYKEKWKRREECAHLCGLFWQSCGCVFNVNFLLRDPILWHNVCDFDSLVMVLLIH